MSKILGMALLLAFMPLWVMAQTVVIKGSVSDADGPLSDAVADMLTCVAVSKVYEDTGKVGFVYNGKPPAHGMVWHDGSVGYHVRKGLHYFDRYDWNMLMSFVKKHMKY